jgi:hypothetical protein
MFKTVSATALLAVLAAPALAQPVVSKGQFFGTTQYTATIDPSGTCAGLGVTPGKTTVSEATVGGLGKAWTSTIANPGDGTTSVPYAVTWINCSFPKLPPATAFTASSIGGVAGPAVTIYTAVYPVPKKKATVAQETTTCEAPSTTAGLNGAAQYTLVSGNGVDSNGQTQSNEVQVIPLNAGGLDSGFKITTTNTQLNVLGNLVCYLSTDALYLDSAN